MAARQGSWWLICVLLAAVQAPPAATAGPYIGDWSWCWRPAPNCPRGQYSPLHYWAPERYYIRMYVHPSNLDQFAPGPTPPVSPSFDYDRYRCRTTPPAPTAAYADPTSYYGRPIAPP
jgi:hypothetical protein